ncbi:MAG: leucine-rich repeat domain-containing protein, partial [Muribaculaceae bacterium]|nr:leucine-rich repeat domain-containing protein [Muribaculaceae bacterium]
MNRFSTAMVKWLACGVVLLASGTAYADYKKGDEVDLTSTLKGRVIEDQVPNKSYVSVEVYQNPDNKPTGSLTINSNYTVSNQNFSVEAIAKSAFEVNSAITTVTLPTSVTDIKTSAFRGCTKLKKINLSEVKYVYDQAFWMSGLTEAIMTNVWHVGAQAFAFCETLEKIEVGKDCRIIEGMAFGQCPAIKEAILHYGLTTIGVNNFTGSLVLEDFVLPYTITSMQSDLTDASAMSRLFILSPNFKDWCVSPEEGENPVGLNLVEHSALKEIYT